MAVSTSSDFLKEVPVFRRVRDIADVDLYRPLPADWVVGLADVVSSTRAIEAGQYKTVNMAGAAVIAAVANALGEGAFPFVFGGDGASFAVPPERAEVAAGALAATATFVREEFGLELRVAVVPVSAVRAAGLDVRVAYLAASPDLSYAMFAGGGIAWADVRMKAGEFAVTPAPAGTRPDLTGLSCRFEEIRAERGVVLSLIVRPAEAGPAEAGPADGFGQLVREILDLVDDSPGMSRPVPDSGPPLAWPAPGLELEARSTRPAGRSLLLHRFVLLARTLFSSLVLRHRIRIGAFDPNRYMAQLVANTDYRKFDDGLRMTVDCDPTLADTIEERLEDAAVRGVCRYGVHRQSAAMMTCITPSLQRSDHIHFVDGAAGGYAAAAGQLKL